MSTRICIKQAFGLATLLALTEYVLLTVAVLGVDLFFFLTRERGQIVDLLPETAITPLLIVFYRVMWLNYPLAMGIIFFLLRIKKPSVILWHLMVASIASYALFLAVLAYNVRSDIDSFGPAAEIFSLPQATSYLYAIGLVALTAPLLVSRFVGDSINWALARIKQAATLTALLMVTEFALMVVFQLCLEVAFLLFGPHDSGVDISLYGEGNWAASSMLVMSFIIVVRMTPNYQIVMGLLLASGGRPDASGARLLVASVAGCALSIALFCAIDYELMERFLFFKTQRSWGGNLLHLVGASAIVAPCVILVIRRRVKKAAGVSKGLSDL